jgi:aromatic ring-opening dioxygenase LigB subunit
VTSSQGTIYSVERELQTTATQTQKLQRVKAITMMLRSNDTIDLGFGLSLTKTYFHFLQNREIVAFGAKLLQL